MQHAEGQKSDIRKSFSVKRRRQLMLSAPMFLLMFGVLFLERKGQAAILGIDPGNMVPLMFLTIAGAVAFSLWNWRCPACKRYLGKQISPKFCSRCGVELM